MLDKINCVVYNIGNHEIDCVHSDTQMKPPKVAAFGGFSSGLSVNYFFLPNHLVIRLPTTLPTTESTRSIMYITVSISSLTEKTDKHIISHILPDFNIFLLNQDGLTVGCGLCGKFINILIFVIQ